MKNTTPVLMSWGDPGQVPVKKEGWDIWQAFSPWNRWDHKKLYVATTQNFPLKIQTNTCLPSSDGHEPQLPLASGRSTNTCQHQQCQLLAYCWRKRRAQTSTTSPAYPSKSNLAPYVGGKKSFGIVDDTLSFIIRPSPIDRLHVQSILQTRLRLLNSDVQINVVLL